ncbi:hypothetical protein TMRO357_01252 [Alteriqipengyuania sp. 357]
MGSFADHFGWIEIVFTAAVALGFGGWQYWSVSREIRRDRELRDREQRDGAKREGESARNPRHPVGKHELDDR